MIRRMWNRYKKFPFSSRLQKRLLLVSSIKVLLLQDMLLEGRIYRRALCQVPVAVCRASRCCCLHVPCAQSAAALATQAARDLLGSAQKQAARLAKHKARAKKHGHRAVRWGQMPGLNLNPQNFQLPGFIRQLGAGHEERSVLVIDSRDSRIQSPYQGWLLDEILKRPVTHCHQLRPCHRHWHERQPLLSGAAKELDHKGEKAPLSDQQN